MNYALGYALNTEDLMCNLPIDKLKVKERYKKDLASKIWLSCVKMVLDDIIDNSDTFELPTVNRNAEIYIKGYFDDDFVKGRLNGKWQDVDYLNTNFTGYLMMLKFLRAGYMVEKPIYLDPKNKDRITLRANSGKTYY